MAQPITKEPGAVSYPGVDVHYENPGGQAGWPAQPQGYGGQQGWTAQPQPGWAVPPEGQALVTAPPPGQEQWMSMPSVPGCPPGLEYLSQIDQLVVKQQVELLEAFTGWETNNKYRVFNKVGQQVYFAAEDTSCLQRQFCGPNRGFTIHIMDNGNKEIMSVVRDFKCCAGCSWCAGCDHCAFTVRVLDAQGGVFGYVRQDCSCWKPRYLVLTPEMEAVGHINGPCCVCNCPCCGDVEFPITGADEQTEIGQIAKHWSGWAKEAFTDADTFSVSFPMDMDVRMKATFMGALFLIDFMYFEKKKD